MDHLFLVRHGQSERYIYRRQQRERLTPEGIKKVRELADLMEEMIADARGSHYMVVANAERMIRTADLLGKRFKVKPVVHGRLGIPEFTRHIPGMLAPHASSYRVITLVANDSLSFYASDIAENDFKTDPFKFDLGLDRGEAIYVDMRNKMFRRLNAAPRLPDRLELEDV
jgi:hypothetical protein